MPETQHTETQHTEPGRLPGHLPAPTASVNIAHVNPRLPAQPFAYRTSAYLDPVLTTEERLQATFNELQVAEGEQERLRDMLAPLRRKHFPTYEHAIRVGLVAAEIAAFQNLDVRALFYAGLLHDVGKASCPLSLLEKTQGWGPSDSRLMSRHVLDGYRLVRDVFDFSAEVILWHHRFQQGGYPKKIPAPLHDYSLGTKVTIPAYGRILSIADTFDALHRINDHNGPAGELTGDQIKEKMLAYNPDRRQLIDDLFRAEILTTYIVGSPQQGPRSATLDGEIYRDANTTRTPRDTARFVQLAAAFEALTNKIGCTTRFRNASRHLQLEYFVVSGVNLGEPFERLAQHVERGGGSVDGIYSAVFDAQRESARNRGGGRVNQGIIELLGPVVAAQHCIDPGYERSAGEILDAAQDVLARTSRADVDQLCRMKRLAYDLSAYVDRTVPAHPAARTVLEYYQYELAESAKATSTAHNGEFVHGFPTVRRMIDVLERNGHPRFHRRVEDAFHLARLQHPSEVAVGFLADCIAVAVYLHLSQHPHENVFT